MREGVIRVRIFPKSPLAPLFQRGGILSMKFKNDTINDTIFSHLERKFRRLWPGFF